MGVSESSLKRWCDSGLLQSIRTVGGHRKITVGEVIRFASENGTRLVSPEEISLSITREPLGSRIADCPKRLAEALLTGRDAAAQQIVMDLFLANRPISTICDEVIAPAFRQIGERWACRSASVYQERRACLTIMSILHEVRKILPAIEESRLAIGGTLSDDRYEIPSAMAELVLRSAGYKARNLGPSIPAAELAQAARDLRPQIFWISVSHLNDHERFVAEFEELSSTCSSVGASLVVGGRALDEGLRRRLTYSAHCDTMKHFETFAVDMKRWSSKSKTPGQGGSRTRHRSTRSVSRPTALKRKRTN